MSEAQGASFDVLSNDQVFMEGGPEKIDFDDFKQPYDPAREGGMSAAEEDCLDLMMLDTGQDVELSEEEEKYIPYYDDARSEGSDESGSECEDGEDSLCFQDQNVEDVKARNPVSLPFNSDRTAGIQLRMLSRFIKQTAKTPIHFFSFFLSFDLVASMCFATNLYAENFINQGLFQAYGHGMGGKWVRVSTMEMYKFIGILMYMSTVKLPSLSRYWETDAVYSNDLVQKAMSQTRFLAILAFLQIAPEYDIKTDDKSSRVEPLIKHMKTVSQSLYQPYRELIIADRMVNCKTKFADNLSIKKRERFGCKLWTLVCSVTGFSYDFLLYVGKEDNKALGNHSQGLPYGIVMTLLKDFKLQGYLVNLGRFYTSKSLTTNLFCKAVYTTGIIRNDSRAIPKHIRDWKEWEEAAMFGEFRWERDKDNYVVVQWKDRRTTSYLSTLHKGSDVTNDHKPKVAHDFQEATTGIEKSLLFMKNYPFFVGKETLHWWKVVFMHCIDMMITNSYVIYKEYVDRFPVEFNNPCDEQEFRESLIKSLLVSKSNKLFQPSEFCIPEVSTCKRECVYCSAQARMEGRSHSGIKTFYMCQSCEVPLCLSKERNCYAQWHIQEGKSIREWFRIYGRKRKGEWS